MGVQDIAASGISGSEVQPYEGPLNPRIILGIVRSDPTTFNEVPYNPERLGISPGPSCVGGLVVYEKKDGRIPHIGAVVEHASLLGGVINIRVVSTLDGRLMLHPLDLPTLGTPSYFLIKRRSTNPP